MRGQRDIVHAQHRIVVGGRFLLQHVERGMRDPAFLQRLDQRLLVHRRATASVDEDRALRSISRVPALGSDSDQALERDQRQRRYHRLGRLFSAGSTQQAKVAAIAAIPIISFLLTPTKFRSTPQARPVSSCRCDLFTSAVNI